jgi:nitrogen fixation protein FixH
MNISQSNKQALQNPWVLAIMLFVLTFVSMNAVFIYLAFKSPPSLVDKNFYENGENYDQIKKKMDQQKALGWTGLIIIPTKTRVNQKQIYEVLLQGKNSASLLLNSVVIKAYRPSDAEADFSVKMINIKPGTYQAELSFPLPGTWDVVVQAVDDLNEFVMMKRVSITP